MLLMSHPSTEKNLSTLNPAQKEAVLHTEGPLLIVAGAGAGKTKTITERIVHLIQTGVSPHNILAVTFTNKAAGEMRERVLGAITKIILIALRLLRLSIDSVALSFANTPATLVSRNTSVFLMKTTPSQLSANACASLVSIQKF